MIVLCIATLRKYTSVSKPEFRSISLGVLREAVEYIKIYKYRKNFLTALEISREFCLALGNTGGNSMLLLLLCYALFCVNKCVFPKIKFSLSLQLDIPVLNGR